VFILLGDPPFVERLMILAPPSCMICHVTILTERSLSASVVISRYASASRGKWNMTVRSPEVDTGVGSDSSVASPVGDGISWGQVAQLRVEQVCRRLSLPIPLHPYREAWSGLSL
jgi:hypothetical protein